VSLIRLSGECCGNSICTPTSEECTGLSLEDYPVRVMFFQHFLQSVVQFVTSLPL
jgi:hypothetical protein